MAYVQKAAGLPAASQQSDYGGGQRAALMCMQAPIFNVDICNGSPEGTGDGRAAHLESQVWLDEVVAGEEAGCKAFPLALLHEESEQLLCQLCVLRLSAGLHGILHSHTTSAGIMQHMITGGPQGVEAQHRSAHKNPEIVPMLQSGRGAD